jgi:tetratricopeptide (TPR) repeat protein
MSGKEALFGRVDETSLLSMALSEAQSGHGSTVLISGPGGIGKTSLLRWLESEALDCQLTVRWGYCLPGVQEPFFPMELLFHQGSGGSSRPLGRMDALPLAFVPRASYSPRQGAMPLAFTPLGSRWDEVQPAAGRAPANVLMDYLNKIESDSRDSPCVLILDDFHWADPDSVQALTFLNRNLGRLPVLLAVGLREDEVQEPTLRSALRDMRSAKLARDIFLKGLTGDHAQKLLESAVEGMLDSHRAASALRVLLDQTDGNPYFFLEVVRLWKERGLIRTEGGKAVMDQRLAPGSKGVGITVPDSVKSLLGQRLRTLSRSDRELLEGASILGQEFEAAPLDELLTNRGEPVGKALVRLSTRKGLVFPRDEGGTHYAFTQSLLWEAVRDSVPEERRKEWSGQLAKWLETHLPADIERIGSLYEEAGMLEKALSYVNRALEVALQMHAYERVLKCAERRIALMERGGASKVLIGECGVEVVDQMRREGGNFRWIEPLCRQLLEMDTPPPVSWELTLRLVGTISGDRSVEARRLLHKLEIATGKEPEKVPKGFAARMKAFSSELLYFENKPEEAAEAARTALSTLAEDEWTFRGHAFSLLGWIDMDRNHWDEAAANMENAIAAAKKGRVLGLIPSCLNLKGTMAMAKGDLPVAESCYIEALSLCRDAGHVTNMVVILTNLASSRRGMCDVDGAEKAAREALRIAETFGLKHATGLAMHSLGQVLLLKRSLKEARECIEDARKSYVESGNMENLLEADMDLAEVRGMTGDIRGALETMKSIEEGGKLAQDEFAAFHMLKSHLMRAMGDKDGSRTEVELALDESRKRSLRYWEGLCLLGIYEWEEQFGLPQNAQKAREEAERILHACGVRDVSLQIGAFPAASGN